MSLVLVLLSQRVVFARADGSVAVIKLADRHEYDEPARETVIPGPRDGIDYACLSPCPFTPNSSSPMSRCGTYHETLPTKLQTCDYRTSCLVRAFGK